MSGLSQNGSNVDSLIASLSQTTLKPDHSTSQQLRQPPQGRPQPSRPQQHQTGFGADFVESPGDGRTRNQTPLSHMSELDRYGLAGLLDTIRNDDPDVTSLAIGHDLTQLGLDLNSSEYVFVYQTVLKHLQSLHFSIDRYGPPLGVLSPSFPLDPCSQTLPFLSAIPCTMSTNLKKRSRASLTRLFSICSTRCQGISCRKSLPLNCESNDYLPLVLS